MLADAMGDPGIMGDVVGDSCAEQCLTDQLLPLAMGLRLGHPKLNLTPTENLGRQLGVQLSASGGTAAEPRVAGAALYQAAAVHRRCCG